MIEAKDDVVWQWGIEGHASDLMPEDEARYWAARWNSRTPSIGNPAYVRRLTPGVWAEQIDLIPYTAAR